jgi:VanZ family protein
VILPGCRQFEIGGRGNLIESRSTLRPPGWFNSGDCQRTGQIGFELGRARFHRWFVTTEWKPALLVCLIAWDSGCASGLIAVTTLALQNDFLFSKWRWLWPVAIAVLIFAVSSRSRLAGSNLAVPYGDKIVHFAIYGLLATSIARLGRGWRAALLAVLITSVYGVSDEWHQSFVPGRAVELADWVADTLGAALAALLYARWPRYRAFLEMPLERKRRVERPATVAAVPDPT